MKKSEIALLLGACAARDSRTVGESDVEAWYEDLGDLEYAEALAAVSGHYRESTDRIMPAHIRRLCRIARDKARAGRAVAEIKAGVQRVDPERAAKIKALLESTMAQIAEKRSVPDQREPEGPPLSAEAQRSVDIHERALARARSERRLARINGTEHAAPVMV